MDFEKTIIVTEFDAVLKSLHGENKTRKCLSKELNLPIERVNRCCEILERRGFVNITHKLIGEAVVEFPNELLFSNKIVELILKYQKKTGDLYY